MRQICLPVSRMKLVNERPLDGLLFTKIESCYCKCLCIYSFLKQCDIITYSVGV